MDVQQAQVFSREASQVLEDFDDERVQRLAAWVLAEAEERLQLAAWEPQRPEAPPCPDCGRRFGAAVRGRSIPQHGPVSARCPGSGAATI